MHDASPVQADHTPVGVVQDGLDHVVRHKARAPRHQHGPPDMSSEYGLHTTKVAE